MRTGRDGQTTSISDFLIPFWAFAHKGRAHDAIKKIAFTVALEKAGRVFKRGGVDCKVVIVKRSV